MSYRCVSDNSFVHGWNFEPLLVGPSKIRINAGCTDRFFLTNVQERSIKLNLSPKVTSHSQFQMLPMDRPDNWDAFNWSWSLYCTHPSHPCMLRNIADVSTLTPELHHSSPVLELLTYTISRFKEVWLLPVKLYDHNLFIIWFLEEETIRLKRGKQELIAGCSHGKRGYSESDSIHVQNHSAVPVIRDDMVAMVTPSSTKWGRILMKRWQDLNLCDYQHTRKNRT